MTFETLYPKEIKEKQMKENALVVDLRPRDEYMGGHWPGALSYPFEDTQWWGRQLSPRRTVILYCDHGGTSMYAARKLGRLGYHIYTVIGGYESMKKIQENYFKM